MSHFSNNPRVVRPIATDRPLIAIPADEYDRLRNVTSPSIPRPIDDGYRRYAKCLACNTAFKIFTCYAQSDRHCKNFGPATHTHFSCGCNGGAAITMEGSVRIGTKKDRVIFVPVSDVPVEQQNQE